MRPIKIENYVYSEKDALWGLTHPQSKWVREKQAEGVHHKEIEGMIKAFHAINDKDIK